MKRGLILRHVYAIVIHMQSSASSSSILSVRLGKSERSILQAAAAEGGTSLSDFVRRKAIEAAEIELLNRSVVVIPAENWENFEAWLNGPPSETAGLREMAKRKPTWEV